jgi:hypothetical protein
MPSTGDPEPPESGHQLGGLVFVPMLAKSFGNLRGCHLYQRSPLESSEIEPFHIGSLPSHHAPYFSHFLHDLISLKIKKREKSLFSSFA